MAEGRGTSSVLVRRRHRTFDNLRGKPQFPLQHIRWGAAGSFAGHCLRRGRHYSRIRYG